MFPKGSGRDEMYVLDSGRQVCVPTRDDPFHTLCRQQITLYEKARSKDKVLAVVSRRPLLGAAALSNAPKGTCEYHVTVQPGVDVAFVLALVSVVDCSAVAKTTPTPWHAAVAKRAGVAA